MGQESKSSPTHDNDDSYEKDDDRQEITENVTSSSQPMISKSWTEVSVYAPSYTGGKVTLCHGRGVSNLYGYSNHQDNKNNTDNDERGRIKTDDASSKKVHEDSKTVVTNRNNQHSDDATLTPFLLAPCGGDLTIIDAIRGIQARTIRMGCHTPSSTNYTINTESKNQEENDDDDDGNMDADAIICYALAPNDTDLITASRNNILRQYDLSGTALSYSNLKEGGDGKGPCIVKKIIGKSGHDLPITCMEFHSSGVFFATGSVDGNVKVWDKRGGYVTHSFRYRDFGFTINGNGGLRGSVTSLSWCPEVTKLWLAVGREDGSIRIHDLRAHDDNNKTGGNGRIVELSDHVSSVTCITWVCSSNPSSSQGFDTLFSAGRDSVINTWSVQEVNDHDTLKNNNKQKKKKKKNNDSNTTISEMTKIVCKRVHTLPVYESIEGMKILPNFYQHFYDQVTKEGIVHKSDIILATAGGKGSVRIWKATKRDSVMNLDNDTTDVSISTNDISGLVCVLEQDKASSFGEKRGGYVGLLLTSHKQQLSSHRVERSLTYVDELIAIDAENNFTFLSVTNTSSSNVAPTLSTSRTIIGHNDEILDLKIIPNNAEDSLVDFDGQFENKKVAIATNSAQIRVFELGTYSCSVLDGHTETVLCIDVSPCGNYLVSCGKDQTMRLWDLNTKQCIGVGTGHTEAVGATALSRKVNRYDVTGKAALNGGGAFIVTASKDKTLKRWNLPGSSMLQKMTKNPGGEEILPLNVFCSVKAHEKDINIVVVAPNDSLIATGSQDKTVKLWNSNDLSLKGTIKGHKRGIWDCQFSMYDRVLATCSGDKTIKLWSLSDCSCVRTFQGHTTSTLRVRFISGGLQLLSSDAEGIIRLWSIRSNECMFSIDAHSERIWALDVSSGLMVTGAADSKLKVFKDTTKELEEKTREQEEHDILLEQKLANHLRYHEYEQALDIALEMEKPRQALKVFNAIVENDLKNGKEPLFTLQRHLKSWDMSRVTQVLKYCRDWNTRAINSHIAMLTIKAIVGTIPADQLALAESVPEILSGIAPYAERHFDRIDKLYGSSYLIDFTLRCMGDLDINSEEEYSKWESSSKFVLPSKQEGDRVQVAGNTLKKIGENHIESDSDIITIGESDDETSSESSDDTS